MCGIAGVYIKDPTVVKSHAGLEKFADELFKGIESRGRQATGYVAVTRKGKVTIDKAPETASKFILTREPLPEDLWYALFHTRFATKGDIKDHHNNHPVIHGTCFTVHNGSVNNDDELFEKYGFKRNGEVDTEILPALMSHSKFEIDEIRKLIGETRGSIACATIDPVNRPGEVYIVRTETSPLKIIETDKFIVWASEERAIKDAWGKVLGTPPAIKKFRYLPEYKMIVISSKGTKIYELDKPPKNHTLFNSYEYGGYENFYTKHSVTCLCVRCKEKREEEEAARAEGNVAVVKKNITSAEIKAVSEEIRKQGDGVARLYKNRGPHVSGRKWEVCGICVESVDPEDMEHVHQRGTMCKDCKLAYNRLWVIRNHPEWLDNPPADPNKADEAGETYYVDMSEFFDEAQIHEVNLWGEDEDAVHSETMDELAKATTVNVETLNFLLFRSDTDFVKDNARLTNFIQLLWDLYDEIYLKNWQAYQPEGEGWLDFKRILRPRPVVIREGLTRIPTRKEGKKSDPLIVNGNAAKRPKKCLFCGRNRRYHITAPQSETPFNYCIPHFVTCATKGCVSEANHTRRDGIRICHTHARNVVGCHADTVLKQQGYEMEEVK